MLSLTVNFCHKITAVILLRHDSLHLSLVALFRQKDSNQNEAIKQSSNFTSLAISYS